MNWIVFRWPRRCRSTLAAPGRQAFGVSLLLAAVLIGCFSGRADGSPAQPHLVILLLPGATLDDLSNPEVPHLSTVARQSAGAWVAAWKQLKLASQPGLRLRVPLRRDPKRPFGVRADAAVIDRLAAAALRTTDLLWIDPGDLERAAKYAPFCLPAKAQEHRQAALRAADALLEALLRHPEIQDLWLLAPPLKRGPGLAPFFWLRPDRQPGLLRSGSTHMAGVVTGADIAATLAGIAGAPSPGEGSRLTFISPPLSSSEVAARFGPRLFPLELMRRLGALAECTDRLRAVANYLIEWLLLLLVGAGAVAVRSGRRLPRSVALAPLLLPALLLLDGAQRGGEIIPAAAILLLMVLGLTGAYFFHGQRAWQTLAATTVAACVVAVLAGDIFRWAVLGNSIRLGVRFYGVGNEYMGWWIGAALLAAGVPDKGRVRPGAVALLLGVALLIGSPALGGKVGGMLTTLAALAVEAWPLLRRRRALAVLALGLAAAAMLALAAWDASRPLDFQTHLGRLAAHVVAEGPRPFWQIASGKLLTNLRLTLGLWGALLAAGVWLILEVRRHAPEAEATHAVSRLLPVAAVAFLCNDSGVIAAALMLSYGTMAAGRPERLQMSGDPS